MPSSVANAIRRWIDCKEIEKLFKCRNQVVNVGRKYGRECICMGFKHSLTFSVG